jgi:hypothetical protein
MLNHKDKSAIMASGREQDVNAEKAPQGGEKKGEISYLAQDVNAKKKERRNI